MGKTAQPVELESPNLNPRGFVSEPLKKNLLDLPSFRERNNIQQVTVASKSQEIKVANQSRLGFLISNQRHSHLFFNYFTPLAVVKCGAWKC